MTTQDTQNNEAAVTTNSNSTNLFQTATRQKFRFPSSKGELSVENLWDLPLVTASGSGASLETVAQAVNRELKAVGEETFVRTQENRAQTVLTQKLDVVKAVIAVKLGEQEAARTVREKAARKAKLLEVLAEKDDAALVSKTREELLAELEALS